MPSIALFECFALTLTQLSLVALFLGLADVTLHLGLQCLQHILYELGLEVCLFLAIASLFHIIPAIRSTKVKHTQAV